MCGSTGKEAKGHFTFPPGWGTSFRPSRLTAPRGLPSNAGCIVSRPARKTAHGAWNTFLCCRERRLAPGDDVEVRLTVDNKEDMNFVIIEDRLPAGFEVRETRNDPRFSSYSSYWDWYAHQERHDERMAFFLDVLPAGRHEFRYVVYPELTGDVLALPAAVWPMYVPSLRAESALWQIRVE